MGDINRGQLAQLLKVSLPTVDALLIRYPDLPVIERGDKGKPWKFDPQAVTDFLSAKRAEELASEAERNDLLEQLSLPIARTDAAGRAISLDDEIKGAKLRQLQRDELKESRFLVPTDEVRATLERAWRRLGDMLDASVERMAAKHNLPDAIRRSMLQEVADARTAFVKMAVEFLPEEKKPQDEQFALQG